MVANVDFYRRPVFFHYYAMDRQRNRYPLVFLYASIIMSIQISKSSLFIHRVLLHIQPGGIDVGSKNIHALFHRFFSDLKHNDRLIHPHRIDFISLFQGLVLLNQHLEFPVSFLFDLIDDQVDALPLCLAVIQKIHIFFCMLFQFLKLVFIIGFPYVFLFHFLFSFLCFIDAVQSPGLPVRSKSFS